MATFINNADIYLHRRLRYNWYSLLLDIKRFSKKLLSDYCWHQCKIFKTISIFFFTFRVTLTSVRPVRPQKKSEALQLIGWSIYSQRCSWSKWNAKLQAQFIQYLDFPTTLLNSDNLPYTTAEVFFWKSENFTGVLFMELILNHSSIQQLAIW